MLSAILFVAGIVGAVRPAPVLDYVREHIVFVAGAGGIGALALALSTGFALALGRGGQPESR